MQTEKKETPGGHRIDCPRIVVTDEDVYCMAIALEIACEVVRFA